MNMYEGLFILKPELKDEEAKAVIKTTNDIIVKNGGVVKKEEAWGKKLLPYAIKKVKEGHYFKVDFEAPADSITKIDGAYKINTDIVRVMITRR